MGFATPAVHIHHYNIVWGKTALLPLSLRITNVQVIINAAAFNWPTYYYKSYTISDRLNIIKSSYIHYFLYYASINVFFLSIDMKITWSHTRSIKQKWLNRHSRPLQWWNHRSNQIAHDHHTQRNTTVFFSMSDRDRVIIFNCGAVTVAERLLLLTAGHLRY